MKFTLLLILISSWVNAQEEFKDYLIQSQKIEAPKRGSLKGDFSKLGENALSKSTGSYTVNLPLVLPSQRGSGDYGVSYSPGFGNSEYGIGWFSGLEITRFRVTGNVNYTDDDLMTPWGHMIQGESGSYYTKGVTNRIRLEIDDREVTVFLPSGGKVYFGSLANDDYNDMDTEGRTYRWYKREKIDLVGHKCKYIFQRLQASGKSYLTNMSYGGLGDDFQYDISFSHVEIFKPTYEYSSGQKITNGHRVSKIDINKKESSSFVNSYSYVLGYEDTLNSPGFYLKSIKRVFPSGDSEPEVTFNYNSPSDFLGNVSWTVTPKFDQVYSKYKSHLTNRNQISFQDFNNDGRLDMEIGQNYEIFLNTNNGLQKMDIEEPSGEVSSWCRFPVVFLRKARKFANFLGPDKKTFVFDLFEYGDGSVLEVCELNGERVRSFPFSGHWKYGLKTVLADVNNDRLPDLVHIRGDSYEYVLNESTDTEIHFSDVHGPFPINLPTDIHGFWIRDINGDGQADLVLKGNMSLYAHYGTADGGFLPDYEAMRFYLGNGHSNTTNISGRSIEFIDFNKDSLADVLIQGDGVSSIYLNNSNHFVQLYIPGLFLGGFSYKNLISGDTDGDGNYQLMSSNPVTDNVLTLNLENHGLGLLANMDDGKGSLVSFEYGKSQAVSGVIGRKTVTTSMRKEVIGEGHTLVEMSYGNAVAHNETFSFLGFDKVVSSVDNRNGKSYLYKYDGVNKENLVSLENFNFDTPNVIQYTDNIYEDKIYDGRSFSFLNSTTSGYKDFIGTNKAQVNTLSLLDENTLCITRKTKSDGYRTLVTDISYEDVVNASEHLTCFEKNVDIVGNEFSYRLDITRDALARPIEYFRNGTSIQTMQYGSNGLVEYTDSAKSGKTDFFYDSNFRLTKVIDPTGVSQEIKDFDLINDSPEEILNTVGTEGYSKFYAYDNLGRLEKEWHDLSIFDETYPHKSYDYKYAEGDKLGVVHEVINASANHSYMGELSYFHWLSGSGNSVGTYQELTNGGSVTGGTKRTLSTGEEVNYRTYFRSNGVDNYNVTMDEITSDIVGDSKIGILGLSSTKETRVYYKTFMFDEMASYLEGDYLVQTNTKNNSLNLRNYKKTDGFGDLRVYIDESGAIYQYDYDELSRLIRITFPSGQLQEIEYDSKWGSVSKVSRSGIGEISYLYDNANGLLVKKIWKGNSSVIDREEDIIYDSIGRVTSRIFSKKDDQGNVTSNKTYSYKYDGNYFNSSHKTDQIGFLTAISGPKYVKEFSYEVDGQIATEDLWIDSKYQMSREFIYYNDRRVGFTNQNLKNLETNSEYFQRNLRTIYSHKTGDFGALFINGGHVIGLQLNNIGQPVWMNTFTTRTLLDRDTLTNRLKGMRTNSVYRNFIFNDRNQISRIYMPGSNLHVNRYYNYDDRGFLMNYEQTGTPSSNEEISYEYNSDGIINQLTRDSSIEDYSSDFNQWNVGSQTYQLDELGRVKEKSGKTLTYGATGRISKVEQASTTLADYEYDEENNPIYKKYADGKVEFYHDDGVFYDEVFYGPLKTPIDVGYVPGYYKNETFHDVHSDHLNTLIQDSLGNFNYASPFGERTVRSVDDHKVLDFTLKGYDSEIEAVRMGRRFYDPLAKRFLTPDSYFFENSDKILESPVEGGLYGYAGNNPISLLDPTGDSVVVSNVKQRAYFKQLINSRAKGTFGFNKKGELYLASTKGGGSKYFGKRIIDAIKSKNVISLQRSKSFSYGTGKNRKTVNVDKNAGGGLTYGVKGGNQKVVISGNPFKGLVDTKGKPLRDNPADILAHEMVGHAIPSAVSSDTGNAVRNENQVRSERGGALRMSEPLHVE